MPEITQLEVYLLLLILAGCCLILIVFVARLEWRLRQIENILRSPLPRALSSKGIVQLSLEHNADFFKARRDEYAKDSPRWKLYDQRMRQV